MKWIVSAARYAAMSCAYLKLSKKKKEKKYKEKMVGKSQ